MMFVGVKMESLGWALEELFGLEMAFLIQLLATRILILVLFPLLLMQYPPRACSMYSTVRGTIKVT